MSVLPALLSINYFFQVRNIITTDIPIITIVDHPIILDIFLLIQRPSIFLSLAIITIATRTGMATTPLITFAYTKALIGFRFRKLIHRPAMVDSDITR